MPLLTRVTYYSGSFHWCQSPTLNLFPKLAGIDNNISWIKFFLLKTLRHLSDRDILILRDLTFLIPEVV